MPYRVTKDMNRGENPEKALFYKNAREKLCKYWVDEWLVIAVAKSKKKKVAITNHPRNLLTDLFFTLFLLWSKIKPGSLSSFPKSQKS